MKYFKINLSIVLVFPLIAFNSIAAMSCSASSIDYPYNTHQEPTPQKAQSNNRIYFYTLPKKECKESVFVISNDKLLKYREKNGYSYVNFINKNGAIVDGWVKNEDIVTDDEQTNRLTYRDFSWKMND